VPVLDLVTKKRVIVCVGAGGVGKTTISAALGVAAAMHGRRTLVLTVDPARRLANALGLAVFAENVQRVSVEDFAAEGIAVRQPLHAAMLDVKRTFDAVVQRHAPSPEVRDRILRHPFYLQASTALAGTQEYMAMERLYEAVTSGEYDLVVLDTPPAEHAIEFLDAPGRLVDLFESAAFRLLVVRGGARARSGLLRTGSVVMRGLSRFTSVEMFGSLLEFFGYLAHTFDGFVERARDVQSLLQGRDAAFVVVSGCDAASASQAQSLADHLEPRGYRVGALVVNRVAPYSPVPADAAESAATETDSLLSAIVGASGEDRAHRTAKAWAHVAVRMAAMANADARVVTRMKGSFASEVSVVGIPRSEAEPDSLRGLGTIATQLAPLGLARDGLPPGPQA
jgi:anion-transporting  ArsA/GET3 family ATPase